MAALERHAWGSPLRRDAATQIVVQQLVDQAQIQGSRASTSSVQRAARAALAKELARQLALMAVGKTAGADGIDAPAPPGHHRVTWEQLGGFAYREGATLPAGVAALAGQHVALPGYMLSLGEIGDLTSFILVESLWGCCFGNVPEMNQMVLTQLHRAAPYTAVPVMVAGTLEVGEEREADYVTSLYRIRSASIHPLP